MNTIETAYRKYCTERFALPTEKQVSDLEEKIGVFFPDDYRQFLLTYNGGVFNEPDIIPPDKECPVDGLEFMNGIGAIHPVIELGREIDLDIFDDNDPPQVVPIGDTIMGNLILLITHYEGNGCIVMKKAFDRSFFLAEGIEEFFGLLQDPSDD